MDTIKKEDSFLLGSIAKTIGLKGEVEFYLDTDDPLRYEKLDFIFIERGDSVTRFAIEKITLRKNRARVKLKGIDSIEEAEKIVKSNLFLPMSVLPPLPHNAFYFHEVKGYLVTDIHYGEIGIIESIIEMPGHHIFRILKNGKEVLLPASSAIVRRLDRTEKTIEIEAPEGLIEIYLG